MGRKQEEFPGARYIRWAARAIGFVATGIFLLFVMGNVVYIKAFGWDFEMAGVMVLLLIASAGYLVAIFNERVGGWMQIGGGAAVSILLLVLGGIAAFSVVVLYGVPFMGSGVLFLLGRRCHRQGAGPV